MVLIDINVRQHRCSRHWYLEGGVKVTYLKFSTRVFFHGEEAETSCLSSLLFVLLVYKIC